MVVNVSSNFKYLGTSWWQRRFQAHKFVISFFKRNKILSLQEHLKKNNDGKPSLIYKTHIVASGLISTYGKDLIEAVKKRDQIAVESFKYMKKKTQGLSF